MMLTRTSIMGALSFRVCSNYARSIRWRGRCPSSHHYTPFTRTCPVPSTYALHRTTLHSRLHAHTQSHPPARTPTNHPVLTVQTLSNAKVKNRSSSVKNATMTDVLVGCTVNWCFFFFLVRTCLSNTVGPTTSGETPRDGPPMPVHLSPMTILLLEARY
ncbi:hypothetical protein M405DRAFT_344914 [Rhizopogon salebrosus TDB-379]|nr:hypothetical protein M405DRAFT_344914 [Rhizopogon salebrosus TDB-379]